MDNKVIKALSQEEGTIVKNIQSLLKELLSASGAAVEETDELGQPVIETPEQIRAKAVEAAKAEENMTDEEKAAKAKKAEEDEKNKDKVDKDVTNTPSDVATANDDAEERLIDSLSEVDEKNVAEVSKAIATAKNLKALRMANKSVQSSIIQSPVREALTNLTQVVKNVMGTQKETSTAMGNILEGLGITKQIEEMQKATKSEPIVTTDNEKAMAFVQTLLTSVKKSADGQKIGGDKTLSSSDQVHKNLSSAVVGMFGPNAQRPAKDRK